MCSGLHRGQSPSTPTLQSTGTLEADNFRSHSTPVKAPMYAHVQGSSPPRDCVNDFAWSSFFCIQMSLSMSWSQAQLSMPYANSLRSIHCLLPYACIRTQVQALMDFCKLQDLFCKLRLLSWKQGHAVDQWEQAEERHHYHLSRGQSHPGRGCQQRPAGMQLSSCAYQQTRYWCHVYAPYAETQVWHEKQVAPFHLW